MDNERHAIEAGSRPERGTPVDSLVMPSREIKSELIRIAALLATCYNLPSDLVDDYPQKSYSASRVAGMMSKAHDHSKMMAYQLRQVADKIKA